MKKATIELRGLPISTEDREFLKKINEQILWDEHGTPFIVRQEAVMSLGEFHQNMIAERARRQAVRELAEEGLTDD